MGFGSPVVRQARHGQRPDGVCLVVGSCARGFEPDENRGADLIYTCTDIREDYQGQYFWEAFPAGSGPRDRTTYMFTYVDADPSRPSLASLLDDYWDLMPRYQGLDSIEQVDLRRVLFGYFPTYRDSPLPARWDRVTQIGDASGMQSPLSFGGLAALLRHIGRLTDGMEDALLSDALDRECLATLNQYQPALSASWLFQKCMSVRPGARPPRDFINRLMGINFGVMESLGDDVSRPFLQDVVKFDSLGKTLLTMAATKPLFVPQILVQAGPGPILDWFGHFANLGVYTLLSVATERGPIANAARLVAGTAPTREVLRGKKRRNRAMRRRGGISPCWMRDEDSCSVERWTRGSGGAGETTAERRNVGGARDATSASSARCFKSRLDGTPVRGGRAPTRAHPTLDHPHTLLPDLRRKCSSAAALIPSGFSISSNHFVSPSPASCCATADFSHETEFLYTLPCSTRRTWRSNLHSSGTRRLRCSYAESRVALFGIHPSPIAIFHTCVSTGKSARLRQNIKTQLTVLGPTPLNRDSSRFADSSSMSRRYSMHAFPRSSYSVLRMT